MWDISRFPSLYLSHLSATSLRIRCPPWCIGSSGIWWMWPRSWTLLRQSNRGREKKKQMNTADEWAFSGTEWNPKHLKHWKFGSFANAFGPVGTIYCNILPPIAAIACSCFGCCQTWWAKCFCQDVPGVVQWHAGLLQLPEDSRCTISTALCTASGAFAHCILLPYPFLCNLAVRLGVSLGCDYTEFKVPWQ